MKPLKFLVVLLLLVFYGSLAAHYIHLPAADDLGRHIKNGEEVLSGNFDVLYKNLYSYTEPDFPLVNHHWLTGVVFYLLKIAVGFKGLTIFKIAVLLAAFSLVFFTALRKANFWLVAFFSLPTIFNLMGRTEVRPEMFSYFFVAAFLYLLVDFEKRPESNRIFFLVPLQLLWVNLHIFFSIGMMMVAGFLVEKIIHRLGNPISNWSASWRRGFQVLWGDPFIRKLAMLFFAVIVVSFINPSGPAATFYQYRLHILSDYPILVAENETTLHFLLQSPPWEDIPVTIFIPMVALLAVSFLFPLRAVFKRRQRTSLPIFYFLASIGSTAVGFYMTRGLPLFGLIFLPVITANTNDFFIKTRDWLKGRWPRYSAILAKVLILVLIGTIIFSIFQRVRGKLLSYRDAGIGLSPYSMGSAAFFKKNHLHGPIFNDTDIGSYLIYNFFPEEKVFSDNRFGDAYSKSFFNDVYLPAVYDEDGWREMSKKYQFNAIFFYHYDGGDYLRPFLSRRMGDSAWALVYADRYALIFVRNITENKKVIDKFQITYKNIGEKLNYLTASANVDDRIAAADIFNLMGRPDLAMKAFEKIVAEFPEKSKIWLIMGEMVIKLDGFENAIASTLYFEKAVERGQKTAESYSWLSAAYIRTLQFEKADKAARAALRIDPNYQAAKEHLEEIKKYWVPNSMR